MSALSRTAAGVATAACGLLYRCGHAQAARHVHRPPLADIVYSTCACLQQASSSTAPVRRLHQASSSTAPVCVYSRRPRLQHLRVLVYSTCVSSSTAHAHVYSRSPRLQHLCVVYGTCACLQQASSSTAHARVYSTRPRLQHLCVVYSTCACLQQAPSSTAPEQAPARPDAT
jgi:hypothetical protein